MVGVTAATTRLPAPPLMTAVPHYADSVAHRNQMAQVQAQGSDMRFTESCTTCGLRLICATIWQVSRSAVAIRASMADQSLLFFGTE